MGLAAAQLLQLAHGLFRVGVGDGADGQGHQQLVDVQPGVFVAQHVDL